MLLHQIFRFIYLDTLTLSISVKNVRRNLDEVVNNLPQKRLKIFTFPASITKDTMHKSKFIEERSRETS